MTIRIDVLIPTIEKDLPTLPYVIDAIRRQVKHPIGHIMIVAPMRKRILEVCRRKGCTFINENSVLPISKKDIHYRSKRWERSSWLYQQLLKLGGSSLGASEFYLVIDADTVLIRPHIFRTGHKTLFYTRSWSQNEYFRTYHRLMKKRVVSPVSFVTHYMLFEKSKVVQLKRDIEAQHGIPWYKAIMRSMDKSKSFAFSEFETYGNFLYSKYPGQLAFKPALNKSMNANITQLSPERIKLLARKYRSISFHKRKGYSRKLKADGQ